MSTVDEVYEYGQDTFNVPERGKIRIEGCPSSIGDQLRRASFTQESPGVFTKSQAALDGEQEYEVVTVTVDGDENEVLHVEATDIIGVVSLTPSSKVQVDPKIDWEHIFDMLLAVYDQNRSIEYHGIPLQDFLSDDIHLDDVFVVLAINYLDGLETIHRQGYIRDLVIRRLDSLDGRGEIDVEQTLLNHGRGTLEPHWIRNETEYDNAANSLLHFAGKTLLRLFRQNSHENDHPAYDRIFSEVHREVEHLESMGVSSGLDRMDEYRRLSLSDLPKQRRYYQKAFDVAKAVMSSSLGQQLRDGPRELVVDYVLNMESLFLRADAELSALQEQRDQGFPQKQEEIRKRHALDIRVTPLTITQVEYERGEIDIELTEQGVSQTMTLGYGSGIGTTDTARCSSCDSVLSGDNPLNTIKGSLRCRSCSSSND